jgi:hypothetical protein
MVFYDYIDIGINDDINNNDINNDDDNDNNDNNDINVNNMIINVNDNNNDDENDNDNKRCIIIEPNKYLLDKMKNKKNSIKLNMYISDYEGKFNMTDIDNYIYVTTLYQIMVNFNINGIYRLNLNLYDKVILKAFFEENKNNLFLPHIITSKYDIDNDFDYEYYDLIDSNDYQLNLTKIKNKKRFSKLIRKYYIEKDYLYNTIDDLPYENTLEAAKEYCINNCCSGITLENNIYQVRRGRYLYNNNDNNIYTWIHL